MTTPKEYEDFFLALVIDAIRCCFRGKLWQQRRGLRELREWISVEDDARYRYAISFTVACEAIGVDANGLKRKLLELVHSCECDPVYHKTMAALCAPIQAHAKVRGRNITLHKKRCTRHQKPLARSLQRRGLEGLRKEIDVALLVLGVTALP